jgi:hypothetical protein
VPPQCLIEINNRYVWRSNWETLRPFTALFSFVINSDAHQPHWLNQNVARYIAGELGIDETLLFTDTTGSARPRTVNAAKNFEIQ